MVKQTMQRKKPSFNEEYYGYRTFSDLLEDAQRNNIIKIKKDQKSGSYVITGFAQARRRHAGRSCPPRHAGALPDAYAPRSAAGKSRAYTNKNVASTRWKNTGISCVRRIA